MTRNAIPFLAAGLLFSQIGHAQTNRYLFVGHPRDDNPGSGYFGTGQIVQREVERVDYSQYDLLMLGGDYTWQGTVDDRFGASDRHRYKCCALR